MTTLSAVSKMGRGAGGVAVCPFVSRLSMSRLSYVSCRFGALFISHSPMWCNIDKALSLLIDVRGLPCPGSIIIIHKDSRLLSWHQVKMPQGLVPGVPDSN